MNEHHGSQMFEGLLLRIPKELGMRSGKVFYSGRGAYAKQADLYVLGLNPGGDPETNPTETVHSHTVRVS